MTNLNCLENKPVRFDFAKQEHIQKDANGIANSIGPDQNALSGAVWYYMYSALFAQIFQSTYSRLSVARALMAPLPQLFRTHS